MHERAAGRCRAGRGNPRSLPPPPHIQEASSVRAAPLPPTRTSATSPRCAGRGDAAATAAGGEPHSPRGPQDKTVARLPTRTSAVLSGRGTDLASPGSPPTRVSSWPVSCGPTGLLAKCGGGSKLPRYELPLTRRRGRRRPLPAARGEVMRPLPRPGESRTRPGGPRPNSCSPVDADVGGLPLRGAR
jgi:hypothetical protein